MLTRRMMIAAALALPAAALAHEGHDLSGLEASVVATRAGQGGLALSLTLVNRREAAVALQAIYTELGEISADLPFELAPGATASAELRLPVADWPGIFTLILDFGEAGLGPVTVIPL